MLRRAVLLDYNDCGAAARAACRPQTCCEFPCCQGSRVHDTGTNPGHKVDSPTSEVRFSQPGRRSLSPGGWTCGIAFDGRSDCWGDSTLDPCDEATSPRGGPWRSSRSVTCACGGRSSRSTLEYRSCRSHARRPEKMVQRLFHKWPTAVFSVRPILVRRVPREESGQMAGNPACAPVSAAMGALSEHTLPPRAAVRETKQNGIGRKRRDGAMLSSCNARNNRKGSSHSYRSRATPSRLRPWTARQRPHARYNAS